MDPSEIAINTEKGEIAEELVSIPQHYFHEGQQLKKYMEHEQFSIRKMAAMLGVSCGGLSLQLKRKYLTSRFKKKLSNIGIHSFKEKSLYTSKDEVLSVNSSAKGAAAHEGEQLKKHLPEHQLHEGEQLQKQLKERKYNIEEAAQKLGVTRQAIYLQFKRKYLSTRFKRKLSAEGLYPFTVENPVVGNEKNTGDATPIEQTLHQEIRRLQTIIALQAEHIREIGKLVSG